MMSRRLDLLLANAAGWIRSNQGETTATTSAQPDDARLTREPEAQTRAAEIQALLLYRFPAIHWKVTLELQQRAIVAGPLEQYVLVRGVRRDGTPTTPIRIAGRDAASTPATKLVRQIEKGLKLDT
jgi:hypothetical protein